MDVVLKNDGTGYSGMTLGVPDIPLLDDVVYEDVRKHNHYFKDVRHLDYIDVYRVLELFNVTDPCLNHLVKKALCSGIRGHKDLETDLNDIVDSANRAVEMLKEDNGKIV